MTAAAVEALSFASLTALLSNPPQYPRNPTHETRDPLVLYIVRVPGSKDVVLTPLKPPTKASISLDAIQSSLYYLHVETPEDEIVRQSVEVERASDENKPPAVPIQRKPLPPTSFANYPPSKRPPSPPKSYPHYQPLGPHGDSQYDRFAARGNNVRFTSDKTPRPLGARPMPSSHSRFEWEGEQRTNEDVNAGDPLKIDIPERPGLSKVQSHSSQHDIEPVSPAIGSAASMRVTLIRRDPTSGAQWNVGSIRVGLRKHHLAPLQPVEVELIAPGYSRFAATPDSASLPTVDIDAANTQHSSSDSKYFRRHLGFRVLPSEQRMSIQDVRTRSNSNGLSTSPNGTSHNKKPRQIYSFTSPWQGMCIFSNGVDGKSLKVRHSLTSHRTTEAEQGNGVAELRLNLPWSVLKLKDTNKQSTPEPDKLPISQLLGTSKKERFRRSMQHFRSDSKQFLRELRESRSTTEEMPPSLPPRPTPENKGQDEYRISLRLGREKAGGGFKGDSAKLGKLILEDEGLKMGDLVVACCMGVFWQHHEG